MTKLDFKKSEKQFYTGKVGRFDVIDVPEMNYLMIDGDGGPVGEKYPPSIAALYALSYGLKFMSKQTPHGDYVVGPLQGLWWADDMNTFITREKSAWKWTMMIRQPDWIDAEMLGAARESAIAKLKKKKDAATTEDYLQALRLERFAEGQCVQVLHVGSYDDEGPILEQMHHQYIPENGYQMRGIHHEIYLGDPRKTAPEKLKTILRQPIEAVG